MDVRNNHTHGPHIKSSLYEATPALMRHPDKRRDARRDGRDADLGRILQRHARVLEIDEEGVVAGGLGDVGNLDAAADFDAEAGADLAGGGEGDEIVFGDDHGGPWVGHFGCSVLPVLMGVDYLQAGKFVSNSCYQLMGRRILERRCASAAASRRLGESEDISMVLVK